jgi:hypothetical protein
MQNHFAQKQMKSGLGFVGGNSPPPKDPLYFSQLLFDTPKIFLGKTYVYLLIRQKKFLAKLSSGQIYKRLKKMFPK